MVSRNVALSAKTTLKIKAAATPKAIIFFPSHPSINHGIFQPLADVSGIDFIHYHTIPKDMKSIHSDFMVDLDKINLLLKD